MLRFAIAGLLLVCLGLSAQERKQEDLSKKPPYERLLTGDALKKAEQLQKQIDEFEEAEKFEEAKKAVLELIELRTARQGGDHYEVINARSQRDRIKIVQKLSPVDREKVREASRQGERLFALYLQGEFASAAKLGDQILPIHKKLLGESHPDYATSLNNLAAVQEKMGAYDKAEPLYLQAKEIFKKL
jgi:tetratricopeptide (TPR) repeat protein